MVADTADTSPQGRDVLDLDPDVAEDDPLFGPAERRVRLRTLVLLRSMAVVGQTATVAFVAGVLQYDIALAPALAVIAASAWLNIFLSVTMPAQKLLSDREAAGQLAFDVTQLTLLLALTGGLANPFLVLLAAPVVIALASLRTAYALAIAALAGAASLAMALWSRPLPWDPSAPFAPPELYLWGLWAGFATSAGFVGVFVWRVASDARRMSTALAASQAVLAREQRLSALGGLAAAAAHELGTPLGTIQVTAREIARQAPPDSDLAEDAQLLISQAQRCRDILQQLSRRGAENDKVIATLSFEQLLSEVVEPLRDIGPAIHVSFESSEDFGSMPMLRRRAEVMYALGNFLENAVDYAETKINVVGRWSTDQIEVEIKDDGPGFTPDVLAKLGEPYISERDGDHSGTGGLGLGFFIAKSFVERTGGSIEFGNRRMPRQGAVVRARWPLTRLLPRDV